MTNPDQNTPDTVQFSIQVRESGLDMLSQIALEVSDPDSPKYGQFLSRAEIDRLTAPHPEHLAAVRRWLSSAKGARVTSHRDRFFYVESSRREAEALLSTSFRSFVNVNTKQTAIRAGDVGLPVSVEDAVTAVFGLHGLPLPPRQRLEAGLSNTPPAKVTPEVLHDTYKISGVTVSRSDKNRQAVAEFQGQTMSHADLAKFFKDFVPNAEPGDEKVSKFVGDPGDEDPSGGEASLDIQYIMGVAPGIKTEFWLFKNMDFCHDLKNWTMTMLARDDVPWVHSVSYGWQGEMEPSGCPRDDELGVDADLMKLAARGISILISSGDQGAGFFDGTKLWPSWPAESPWVTAVGATRFVGQVVGAEEMATDRIGSGGGFSWRFERGNATWQEDAVAHYFKVLPSGKPHPPADYYLAGGRATPDVSALGEGFQVYNGSRLLSVGGTSASTPSFAAIVSLLNEARMQDGKARMGFLNLFLYKNAESFTDVTKGTNAIGFGYQPLKYGWNCTKGWDPATGLGTPTFDKLLAAAKMAAGSQAIVV